MSKDEKKGINMYIITGGAGFIGSALIWELNKKGIDNIFVVDNLSSTTKWKNLIPLRYIDYIHKNDFIQKVRSDGLPEKVQAIVHLGACSSTLEQNADYLMDNNFHYTRDLYLAAQKNNIRFINASSAATYGDGSNGFSSEIKKILKLRPLNMYGYSKQLFDLWTLRTGSFQNLVSLKFFNVYGPNEYHKDGMRSVVCKAVTEIQNTGQLNLFKSYRNDYLDGEQKRDFIYIKDVVKLIAWLLEKPSVNGIFNLGQGQARSWNDLAKAVFNEMGKGVNINYIDMPEPLKKTYQYYTESDMSWLKKEKYPHTFYTLEEGIADYVQNYLLQEYPYLTTDLL